MNIPRPREGEAYSRFGFVNFVERVGAMKAVEDPQRPAIDGAELVVSALNRGLGAGGYRSLGNYYSLMACELGGGSGH